LNHMAVIVMQNSECRMQNAECRTLTAFCAGRHSQAVKSVSLREALGTPESARTATPDRSPLGSRPLSRSLNLAEALSRLTLSGDLCRHASNASLLERLFTDVSTKRRGHARAAWSISQVPADSTQSSAQMHRRHAGWSARRTSCRRTAGRSATGRFLPHEARRRCRTAR
jgi:hypothetical protein